MALDKIHIVTDSTSDLSRQLLDANITIVPLKVYLGDKEYLDNIDITPKEFCHKIKTQGLSPQTSQPAPGDFLRVYNKLKEQGKHKVISIHLSSKLSGTVQSAIIASKLIEGLEIRVVDSQSASLGLGFLCLAASRYLKEMIDFNQIIERIETDKLGIEAYFTLGSLEYLEKGGRIGKARAFLGKLFGFKPILTVVDGEIQPVARVSGDFHMAIVHMAKLIKEKIEAKKDLRFLGVVHSCVEREAQILVRLLKKDFRDAEVSACRSNSAKNHNSRHIEIAVSELGCVLGSHVGPEAIGVVAL